MIRIFSIHIKNDKIWPMHKNIKFIQSMDFIEYLNLFCRFVEEIVLVQNQPNYKYMFFFSFIHSFIIYCECFNRILFGWPFFHDDNFICPKVKCVMQFFFNGERKKIFCMIRLKFNNLVNHMSQRRSYVNG